MNYCIGFIPPSNPRAKILIGLNCEISVF